MPVTVDYLHYGLLTESLTEGRIDLRVDEVWCMICTSAYIPNQHTHKYRSIINGEIVGSGYSPGGMRVPTILSTYSASTKSLLVTAGNTSWPNVTWTGARYGVVYAKKIGSLPASQPLLTYIDFGQNENRSAAPFYINWPSGILMTLDLP